MATPRTTIPDLPEQTAVVDTNLLVVQDGTATKKMTVGRLTTASTSAVDAHIAAASGAHAASAISAIPSAAPFDGTDVQTQLSQGANALASINAGVGANTTGLANHLADTSDAHDASAISVVAGAGVVATDVQGALVELQGEITTAQTGATTANTNLTNHLNDTSAAHAASAVSVLPAGNLNSTDVQAALTELQVAIDAFENTSGITQAAADTRYVNVTGDQINGSLVVWNDDDVSLSGETHALTIGPTDTNNLALSYYEIQARDGIGAAATLFVQGHGGDVFLGSPGQRVDVDSLLRTQGGIDARYMSITNVAAPVNSEDATNKTYVDGRLNAKDDKAQTIETATGGTYSVVAADSGKLKRLTGTATVTLPSAGLATGERVDFVCIGGPATFVLGGGATWDVAPTPSAVARAIGSFVTAIKMGATTWVLTGDLA